jgi:hypothetical protein
MVCDILSILLPLALPAWLIGPILAKKETGVKAIVERAGKCRAKACCFRIGIGLADGKVKNPR